MNVLNDITAYFRRIAEEHGALRHSAAERHFFRGEGEEFFKQFRSDVRFPCLVLEGSTVGYVWAAPRLRKCRQGAFIVCQKYDQLNDYDDIVCRMSECESIGDDIVRRLIDEAGSADSPFLAIDTESITGSYMDNQGNRYVGYRVEFETTEEPC